MTSTDARSGRRIDRSELRPHATRVGRKYYVRMGAFDDMATAEDFAAELRRVTTQPVNVAEFGVGSRNAVRLYRVLIGPTASRDGVIELVAELQGMGYGPAQATRTDASAAEPAAGPGVASSQPAVGPDLVEVSLDSMEQETAATQAVTSRPRSIPMPAPEREVAKAGQALSPEGADPAAAAADTSASRTMAAPAGDGMEEPRGNALPQVAAYAPRYGVQAFIVSRDGQRFLQMGAYAARNTAEILASQLRSVTPERVFVAEMVDDDGRSLHRVRIGPIESDASLAALAHALGPDYGTDWAPPATSSTRSAPSTASPTARKTGTAFIVVRGSEGFVQVGAYSARSTASMLASELRLQVDPDVRVTEVMRESGGSVYRVRIGPVPADSLDVLIDALETLGYVID